MINITASFSEPPAPFSLYWIALQQIPWPTDIVSVSQAAEAVDAVFHIPDPCVNRNSLTGGQAAPATIPTAKDDFNAVVAESLNFSACKIDAAGNYSTTISVYISHLTEDYKFKTVNCKIQTVIATEEDIEQTIKVDGYFFTTDKPIEHIIECSAAIKNVQGSTVQLRDEIIGAVKIKYHSRHDEIKIKVLGNPITLEPGNATVFGFFHNIVETLTITPPPVDPKSKNLSDICGRGTAKDEDPRAGGSIIVFPKPNIQCYEKVNYQTRCLCSGTLISEIEREHIIDCPESITSCPQGVAECRICIEERDVTIRYQMCGDPEQVHDSDYYQKICCEPPPLDIFPFGAASLPICETIYSIFYGGRGISGGVDRYRSIYGADVRLIPVGTKDGVCGETTTNQTIKQKNCCDGVLPIYWDYDNSAEVIADNSKALVVVTGGQAPYNWQVRGSGFWANEAHTWRDVETDVPYLWIYTKDACGPCYIWANDGCSDTSGLVRSTVGQWVLISDTPCAVVLDCGQAVANITNICIQGKYKVEEAWGSYESVCCTTSVGNPYECAIYGVDFVCSHTPINYYFASCGFTPPVGYTACSTNPHAFWKINTINTGCAYPYTDVVNETGAHIYNAYEWRC